MSRRKNRKLQEALANKQGCPRNNICLLVRCRFTRRVWSLIAGWVHYHQLLPSYWSITHSVRESWHMMGNLQGVPPRALKSLLQLVNWEIWKERNARTFNRQETLPTTLLSKIKEAAQAWGITGARHLADLIGV
ncbi:hypothetical protein PAHAL_9G535900 [Panicum hallii]|uniref:Uncharacterized protein n=1 Tax=Panicum hallii TaxID=206008 RepID=A0A2T8I5L6_9POAL|nr:hypothetical protein PAHAL_9G535900 [Panicum hallii]